MPPYPRRHRILRVSAARSISPMYRAGVLPAAARSCSQSAGTQILSLAAPVASPVEGGLLNECLRMCRVETRRHQTGYPNRTRPGGHASATADCSAAGSLANLDGVCLGMADALLIRASSSREGSMKRMSLRSWAPGSARMSSNLRFKRRWEGRPLNISCARRIMAFKQAAKSVSFSLSNGRRSGLTRTGSRSSSHGLILDHFPLHPPARPCRSFRGAISSCSPDTTGRHSGGSSTARFRARLDTHAPPVSPEIPSAAAERIPEILPNARPRRCGRIDRTAIQKDAANVPRAIAWAACGRRAQAPRTVRRVLSSSGAGRHTRWVTSLRVKGDCASLNG